MDDVIQLVSSVVAAAFLIGTVGAGAGLTLIEIARRRRWHYSGRRRTSE